MNRVGHRRSRDTGFYGHEGAIFTGSTWEADGSCHLPRKRDDGNNGFKCAVSFQSDKMFVLELDRTDGDAML